MFDSVTLMGFCSFLIQRACVKLTYLVALPLPCAPCAALQNKVVVSARSSAGVGICFVLR